MIKDSELERLRIARDEAYRTLDAAREEKNRLGKECSKLHEKLDDAYKDQNRIYEEQQKAWEFHRSLMQDLSQKIAAYKAESDNQYSKMVDDFQRASSAWSSGSKAAAKDYSNSGNDHKAAMRAAKEKISYLVGQSRDAKYRFENNGIKENFEKAKRRTAQLKAEFTETNARYQPMKASLEEKQSKFDQAKKAFDDRLEWLKSEFSRKKNAIVDEKSTIYARFRSGHSPISIPAKVFYDRNNPDGPFHLTMKYSDGYRVSWDATSRGDKNFHWTNENIKGGAMRHVPPDDATVK